MVGGIVVRATAGPAIRRSSARRASRHGDVHGQEDHHQPFVRNIYIPVLRNTDVPDHVSQRADWPKTQEIEHDCPGQK